MGEFKHLQIVCLEQENTYLYNEVIQVVEKRDLSWVRPLVLVLRSANNGEIEKIVDVRGTSDLLLGTRLFREALDTEVIPLLLSIEPSDLLIIASDGARAELHKFIEKFVRANMANCL